MIKYDDEKDEKLSQGKNNRRENRYERGQKVIVCKYKCKTNLYYDFLLDAWLESNTHYHHSKRRCYQIKEMRMKEAENESSKIREIIVEEMTVEYQSKDLGNGTKLKALVELLKDRTEPKDSVTKDEIGAVLYPECLIKNDAGITELNYKGITRIMNLFHRVRKIVENECFAPFSKVFENGVWYYWNIQVPKDYEEIDKRLEKNEMGTHGTRDKFRDVTNKSPKQRAKEQQEFDEFLNNHKAEKKKD